MRGNTQRALVAMLREAGAAEVHVRISSPPITWPCFYGIDFASRAELIATGLGVDEVRQVIGADSLGYLSQEGMIASTEQPRERLCTACFTGEYPIPLPDSALLGKNLLEGAVTSNGCDPGPDAEFEGVVDQGTARENALARQGQVPFGDPGRQE